MSPRFPESFFTLRDAASFRETDLTGEAEPQKSLRLPDGYEPNYAYPLLVWMHDGGGAEHEIHRVLPAISDRNFVGLGVRGEKPRATGYDWHAGPTAARKRASRVAVAVRDLRRHYNLHTERVILAGRGTGADAAARTFFARPEWFGGLVALGPTGTFLPTAPADSVLEGKPVLIDAPPASGGSFVDRLSDLGMFVTRCAVPSDPLGMLRQINRWLLADVCGVA